RGWAMRGVLVLDGAGAGRGAAGVGRAGVLGADAATADEKAALVLKLERSAERAGRRRCRANRAESDQYTNEMAIDHVVLPTFSRSPRGRGGGGQLECIVFERTNQLRSSPPYDDLCRSFTGERLCLCG